MFGNCDILTSNGWAPLPIIFNNAHFNYCDIGVFVDNALNYSKPNRIESVDEENLTITVLDGTLKLSPNHNVIYAHDDQSWDLQVSPVAELVGKDNIFVPRTIYIPDDIPVSPELQREISLFGMMAFIYIYAEEYNREFVILKKPDEAGVKELADYCGFLRYEMNDSFENQIIIDYDNVSYNLCPLVLQKNDNGLSLKKVIPRWFSSAHPYALRKFIDVILRRQNDLDEFKHLDSIQILGMQSGIALCVDGIKLVKIDPVSKICFVEAEGYLFGRSCYLEVGPTDVISLRYTGDNGDEAIIIPGNANG